MRIPSAATQGRVGDPPPQGHEPDLIPRAPLVSEYQSLLAAVGWKPRDPIAIERGLAGSCFSICAELDGEIVGMGRVIGDGGLHYYLSDIVVRPEWQRRGIGTRIVRALGEWLDALPHSNTHVGVASLAGLRGFYERLGYRAQGPEAPAMVRWLRPTDPSSPQSAPASSE